MFTFGHCLNSSHSFESYSQAHVISVDSTPDFNAGYAYNEDRTDDNDNADNAMQTT